MYIRLTSMVFRIAVFIGCGSIVPFSGMDPDFRRLVIAVLPALVQPPPDATEYFGLICSTIIAIISLPPDPMIDIHNRLFAEDNNIYSGRDVFSLFAEHRYQFYELTGETPETFLELVNLSDPPVQREHRLTLRNRLLLFMIWLRSYPCYSLLSAIFDVSKNTVKDEIKSLIPVFERGLRYFLRWPTIVEWQEQRGVWDKINVAVGAIDGTSHEIYRPQIEPQEQYYSGHRKYHAIHTQIIVDAHGMIRYVECGFFGHQNDAQQFSMMRTIGTDLPFPNDCFLLGDKIYPNIHPVLTPYTSTQLARKQLPFRKKCIKLNSYIRKYRIRVEHSIGELKCYRSISTIWRHPRHMLPPVVNVCAYLVCRRKLIGLVI